MAETADTKALERCTGASDSEPDSAPPAAPVALGAHPATNPGDAALPATLKRTAAPEDKVVGMEGASTGGKRTKDSALYKAEVRMADGKGGDGAGGGGSPSGDVIKTRRGAAAAAAAAEGGVEMKRSSNLESEDASEDDDTETTDTEDDDEEAEDDEKDEEDEKDEDGEDDEEDNEDKDDNEPPDTAFMLEQVVNKLKVMEVEQQGREDQGDEDNEETSPVAERSSDICQGSTEACQVDRVEKSGEATEGVSTDDMSAGSMKAEDGTTSAEMTDLEVEGANKHKHKNSKTEESADESEYLEARDSTSIEKSSFLKDSFQSLKKLSEKSMDDDSKLEGKSRGKSKAWESTSTQSEDAKEEDQEMKDGDEDDDVPDQKEEDETADDDEEDVAKKMEVQNALMADASESVPKAESGETLERTGGELATGEPPQSLKPDTGAIEEVKAFLKQMDQRKMGESSEMMEETLFEPLEVSKMDSLTSESSEQVRAFACEVARFLADLAVDIASERAFADVEDVGELTDEDTAAVLTLSEDDIKPETKELPARSTTAANTTAVPTRAPSAPTSGSRVASSHTHRVKGRAPPPPTMPAASVAASVSASESKSAPSSSGELRQARAVRVSVRAHAQAASAWPHPVPAPAADSVSSSKYTVRDYPVEDAKEEGENEKPHEEGVEGDSPECPWRDAVRAAVMGCHEEQLQGKTEDAMGGMQPRHEYFTYVSTLPAVARTSRTDSWGVDFEKGLAEEAGDEGGDEEEDEDEEEGDEESSSGAEAKAKAAPPRARRRERRDTPRVADTEDEFDYATDQTPTVVTRRAITEPEDDEDEDDDEDEEDDPAAIAVVAAAMMGAPLVPQPCVNGAARVPGDDTPLSSQPASAEREAGAKAEALAASGPAQRRPPRSRWERWMRRFLGGLGAGIASQDSSGTPRGAMGLPSSTVVDPSAVDVIPASAKGSGGVGLMSGLECGTISQTGSLPRGTSSLGRLAATLRARTLPAAFHATQKSKGKRTKEEKQHAKEEKMLEKQRRRALKQGATGGSGGGVSNGAAGSSKAVATASASAVDTRDKEAAAAAEALGALATMKRRSAQLWRRTLGLRRGDGSAVAVAAGTATAAVAPMPIDDGGVPAPNSRYVIGHPWW